MARQAVIFFFLPKSLCVRHIPKREKNIWKNFLAVQKYRTTLCLSLHCQKENILTGRGMRKLFLRVGQRFFRFYPYLQIYNNEQTKNSPPGHPARKRKLWIALSQSAEHPPNAAPPLAPLGQMPAATSRFLLLPPFRCRHLRRHPFGRPLHPPRWMRHRRQIAGTLGAVASVRSRPLRGLRLRSLRPFADDGSQSLRSGVCQPVVCNGEAGNGHSPCAALCGRTD